MLASAGIDIIGIDISAQLETVAYPMATTADLDDTATLLEKQGRRMVAIQADVRDAGAVRSAVQRGMAELGRLDIVLANAGIMAHSLPRYANSERAWQDSIDTMLTCVWNTLQATAPTVISGQRGGAIVITSSSAGLRANHRSLRWSRRLLRREVRRRRADEGLHEIAWRTQHPGELAAPLVN
jgi:NAD(P)-dependent dehydrogenase (short-subunit alcohol dehydrogenase family)